MAIRIIEDGPEVRVTSSEYSRLAREYQQNTSFMVDPPTFEEFVRSRVNRAAQSSGADSLREPD